jgi:hypothetical protein
MKNIQNTAAMILVLFTGAFCLWSFTGFQTKDWTDCLKKYDSKWGEYCENCNNQYENSYKVFLKNTCEEKLDVKCAVQENNKKWKTYSWTAMTPNDTMIAYACNGTGKYLWWARKSGDKAVKFPNDDEINAQYKE